MNSKDHPCPDCRYPKRIDEDYCPTCPFAKLEVEQKSRWSSFFDFGGNEKAPRPSEHSIEDPFPQVYPQQNNEKTLPEVRSESIPNPYSNNSTPQPQGRPTMLPGAEVPFVAKNAHRGTFNPYTQPLVETPKFKLTSIPRHTETGATTNEFEGDEVILKRSNLDKENYTISSQEHASIIKSDKKWYISNKSSLKTTYIQVNSTTEIKDGDVILIGDRMFIFRPE